jgi:two-component system sporulation sensor kinase C
MQVGYFSAFDNGLQSVLAKGERPATIKSAIGLLIRDSANLRLVESASLQLQLTPVFLTEESLCLDVLAGLELIAADESFASRINAVLTTREVGKTEGINPAVIAICPDDPGDNTSAVRSAEHCDIPFDGLLCLPQAPSLITAQLSVILYSHRSFARRYQSALEELNLNRRIFRSVTSGISVASATLPDLPLTYVNPAFEVMTGYTLEEAQGRNCRFLQGNEHDEAALTLIRDAIQSQRETVAILKNFRKDGTPFWNELSLSPIRNREGHVTHFVGIQNDVTARVEFEAALRESEKLAAVGRLASSIAHEINNPLESVMNLVYLAQHSGNREQINQYLATADKELQRVKLITSRSLRFYKQSTRPQAVKCTDLLNSVLDVYQSRLHNHSVSVERRERSMQSIVCMDSEIRQVLNNLVSNAIDAMNSKGGRLLIRSREATEWRSGAHGVMITIADTGTGINSETMKNIYKAFYTTKGIGGTGLGLWISSEIVERHHGRLLARSGQHEGRSGTVFELFLPYQGSPAACT